MLSGLTRPAFLFLTICLIACGAPDRQKPAYFDTVDHFSPAQDSGNEMIKNPPALNEVQFQTLIHQVIELYQPLAARHDARITLRIPTDAVVSKECLQAKDEESILHCSWESAFTNADAGRSRQAPEWYIGIGGGLARLPAMTPEGLTLVLCHEIGHLFGGFPFVREGFTGLALPVSVDGQADYFAAQVCARRIWAQSDNARNAQGIPYDQMIEPMAVTSCNRNHQLQHHRELCYKTLFAGMSFVKALGSSGEAAEPSVGTPDLSEVDATDNLHPIAQCRLDTFVAGALCPTSFEAGSSSDFVYYDETQIPGYHLAIPGGDAARRQSMTASCHQKFRPEGARPRCWFSPEQTDEGGWMNDL